MIRSLALVAITFCLPPFLFGQSADWGALFREGASASEAARERVRQRDENKLMRQDSADVLRPLFETIQNHFSDDDLTVRLNSVNAIGLLNPKIPEAQLHALADLVASNNKTLTMSAIMGLARIVNKDGFAYETMQKIIAKHDALTGSAVQALTATRSFNEPLIRQIVPLLNSGDEALMTVSLTMVENFGNPAIVLSRDELAILANDSRHQQMADRASKLLENSR